MSDKSQARITMAKILKDGIERRKRKAESSLAPVYSTVPLPDGIVIGGPWPHTIISWPGGKSRGATKPEYDLFQMLEKAHAEIEALRGQLQNAAMSEGADK